MSKKPDHSLRNNRWLYVGFIALGVMAIWLGVMLGNYLLNKVANAEPDLSATNTTTGTPTSGESESLPLESVSADYIDEGTTSSPTLYRVRVGKYSGLSVAKKAEKQLQELGLDTYVIGSGSGPYYVQVGAFRDKNNADRLTEELKIKGYDVYIMQ